MEYRRLGTSSLNMSAIGFGGWAMGKWMWGDDVVDDDSIAAVHKSLELGINFFDTAQVYGFGHSETVLGKALEGHPRDQVIIATKTGLEWDDNENVERNSRPEYVLETTRQSLERLQTDYIDLMQIHWPDEKVPFEETAAAMKELHDAGTIRAVGVSNYSVEQMQRFMSACTLHSLQPPYSMLNRGIEAEILPFCRDNDIGVLAYSPMARGLLTGKYDETATFPKSDARSGDGLWQGERLKRNIAAVRELTDLAKTLDMTMAQLAMAWVLNQPGITCALSGTKRPHQIEETAAAAGRELSAEVITQIDEILQRHEAG